MGQHQHDWQAVAPNHIAEAVADRLARTYDGDIQTGALGAWECPCGAALVGINSMAGDRIRAIREGSTAVWRKLSLRGGELQPLPKGGERDEGPLWPEGEPDFTIGEVAQAATEMGLSVGGPPPHRHRWEGASIEDAAREAVHSRLMTVGEIGSSSDMSVSRCIDCKQQMAEVTDLPSGKTIRALRAHPHALWHLAEGDRDCEVQGERLFEQPPADGPEGPACNWRPHDWQPAHLGDLQKIVGAQLNFGADSYRGEVCMDCGAQRVIADAVGVELTATREQNDYTWRGSSGLTVWREGAEPPKEALVDLPPPPRFRKGQAVTNGKVGYSGEVEVVLRVGDLWHYQVMPDSKRHPVGADEAELQPRHRHDWRVGANISDEIHDRVVKTLEREIDAGPDSTVFSCGCGAVLIVAGTAQDTRQAIRTAEGAAWYWAKGQGSDVQPSVPLWPDLPPREGVGVSGIGHVGGPELTPERRRQISEATGMGDVYVKPAPGQPLRSWEVGPAEWEGKATDAYPISASLRPIGMDSGYALPSRTARLVEADCQIVIEPDMRDDDPEDEPRDRFAVTPNSLATVLAVLTTGGPGHEGERGGYHFKAHRDRLREALAELLCMTPDAVNQHLATVDMPATDDQLEAMKLIQDSAVVRIWKYLRKGHVELSLWEVGLALVLGGNLRPGRVNELERELAQAREARERDAEEVKATNERAEAIMAASTQNTLVARGLMEIVEPLAKYAAAAELNAGRVPDLPPDAAEALGNWHSLMAAVDPTKE